jgi:hypothetical protein
LSQVLLVGLGADLEDVADGELGLAEGGGAAADEGAGQLLELLGGGLGDGLGQLLDFLFLFLGQRLAHGGSWDSWGGFLAGTAPTELAYQFSTKYPDAHTVDPGPAVCSPDNATRYGRLYGTAGLPSCPGSCSEGLMLRSPRCTSPSPVCLAPCRNGSSGSKVRQRR